jgi:hypothetical protein
MHHHSTSIRSIVVKSGSEISEVETFPLVPDAPPLPTVTVIVVPALTS